MRFDFSFMEVCEWLQSNMNDVHPTELVVIAKFGLFPITIRYEAGGHSYHSCWVSFKSFRKWPISILINNERIEIQSESDWMDWEYVEEELLMSLKVFEEND